MANANNSGFKNFSPSILHGSIYSKEFETDGSLWLPAIGGSGGFVPLAGTWTPTRAAAGDYYQALTAAANSPIMAVDLNQVFEKVGVDPISLAPSFPTGALPTPDGIAPTNGFGRVNVSDDYPLHIIRGIQLVGYEVVFSIATAALTTHTATIYETTYDGAHAAGVVATKDAAAALGTATNANIQIASHYIATPFVIGNNASAIFGSSVADWMEINITNPGTSVYHLYGVRLFFNYCLL